jgi:hypothetical protein
MSREEMSGEEISGEKIAQKELTIYHKKLKKTWKIILQLNLPPSWIPAKF